MPTYWGILKRWTGSDWIMAKLLVYKAGSWQTPLLKMWDGTDWRLIQIVSANPSQCVQDIELRL